MRKQLLTVYRCLSVRSVKQQSFVAADPEFHSGIHPSARDTGVHRLFPSGIWGARPQPKRFLLLLLNRR